MATSDELLLAVAELSGQVREVKTDRAADRQRNRILAVSVLLDIALSLLLYVSNNDVVNGQHDIRAVQETARTATCDTAQLWLTIIAQSPPSKDPAQQKVAKDFHDKYQKQYDDARCGHPAHLSTAFNWVNLGFKLTIAALVALLLYWGRPWRWLRRKSLA